MTSIRSQSNFCHRRSPKQTGTTRITRPLVSAAERDAEGEYSHLRCLSDSIGSRLFQPSWQRIGLSFPMKGHPVKSGILHGPASLLVYPSLSVQVPCTREFPLFLQHPAQGAGTEHGEEMAAWIPDLLLLLGTLVCSHPCALMHLAEDG